MRSLCDGRRPTWWIVKGWCLVFWFDFATVFAQNFSLYSAIITYTYNDSTRGELVTQSGEIGRFGIASRVAVESGWVVHVLTENGHNHGCSALVNAPRRTPWVALVERGGCTFHKKVENSWLSNASAVVVYNHKDEDSLITMQHYQDTIVSVFIRKKDGEAITRLVDGGIRVYMNISVGTQTLLNISQYNDTVTTEIIQPNPPMIIILLTFLTILIIALTALLVYAVKRAKYVHAKYHTNMVLTIQDTQQAEENLLDGDIQEPPDLQETQINQ